MLLSVVIVTFNSESTIQTCISALLESTKTIQTEIFIVDNNSKDSTSKIISENFPQVKFIQNSGNLGFGKANNMALREAKGKFILILNPDAIVNAKTLNFLIKNISKNEKFGFVTPKLLLENGNLDLACKRSFPTPEVSFYRMFFLYKIFPNNPKFTSYNLSTFPENENYTVDSISGAFMFCRKKLLQEIGFFDEKFFMYGEDLDFCLRAKKAGFENAYFGEIEVTHLKSVSSKNLTRIKPLFEFYKAMLIFYNKHFAQKYSLGIGFIVYIGVIVSFLTKLIFTPLRAFIYARKTKSI